MLARQVGRVAYMPAEKAWELIELKKKWGYADPRHDPSYAGSDLFADDVFRDAWQACGVSSGAFGAPDWSRAAAESKPPSNGHAPQLDDATIDRIAERVAEKLRSSQQPYA
jgi:L-fuculose-phosphate aldolase